MLVPIVGLGAFLWWAGRDIVQDSVSLLDFSFISCFVNSFDHITEFMGFHVKLFPGNNDVII